MKLNEFVQSGEAAPGSEAQRHPTGMAAHHAAVAGDLRDRMDGMRCGQRIAPSEFAGTAALGEVDDAEITRLLREAGLPPEPENDRALAGTMGGAFLAGLLIWGALGFGLWRLL